MGTTVSLPVSVNTVSTAKVLGLTLDRETRNGASEEAIETALQNTRVSEIERLKELGFGAEDRIEIMTAATKLFNEARASGAESVWKKVGDMSMARSAAGGSL